MTLNVTIPSNFSPLGIYSYVKKVDEATLLPMKNRRPYCKRKHKMGSGLITAIKLQVAVIADRHSRPSSCCKINKSLNI